MKPLKLVMSGFGPFADREEIDFEREGLDGLFLAVSYTHLDVYKRQREYMAQRGFANSEPLVSAMMNQEVFSRVQAYTAQGVTVSGEEIRQMYDHLTTRDEKAFAQNIPEYERVLEMCIRDRDKPVAVYMRVSNPMVWSEVEPLADVILVGSVSYTHLKCQIKRNF